MGTEVSIEKEFGPTLDVIGQRVRDTSKDWRHVTGQMKFAEDIIMPGKLFARILGSPHAHAKIVSIDTSRAEALEGVKAAITHEDNPNWSDEVLGVNEPVAAVAAVDEVTAERALDLIDVVYDVLEFTTDPEVAMQPGAPIVGTFPDSNMVPTPSSDSRGDVVQGLMDADVTVEVETEWSKGHSHIDLEPDSAIAWWEGDDLWTWVACQGPFGKTGSLGGVFNIPRNQVHVNVGGTGGGFGGKGGLNMDTVCALLSKKTGTPVACRMTRNMYAHNRSKMFGTKAIMKMGAKYDGTLTAIDLQFWTDGGKNAGGQPGSLGYIPQHTWKCPNWRFEHWRLATNTPGSGAWRGVSCNPGQFLSDILIETMAEKLELDPLEFRRRIFVTEDMVDQDTGNPLDQFGLTECLENVALDIDYANKHHDPGTKILSDGRLHGIGIGAQHSNLGWMGVGNSAAVIYMNADGTCRFANGAALCQGRHMAYELVVAETIGLTVDQVHEVSWGCSDDAGEDAGMFASRSAPNLGGAFKAAAEDVRAQLFAIAAQRLEVEPEDLDASLGEIFVKDDPTKSITHAEAVSRQKQIIGTGVNWGNNIRRPVGNFPIGHEAQHNTAIAAAAEVAVDPETGEVELLKFANSVDAGRALDRVCCEQQMSSGMTLDYGQAMVYDEIYDPVTGHRMNFSMLNDRLATTMEVCPDENHLKLVESISSVGPYGAQGIGEPGATCTYAVINNAVCNAIGKRMTSRPFTIDKILKAMGKV